MITPLSEYAGERYGLREVPFVVIARRSLPFALASQTSPRLMYTMLLAWAPAASSSVVSTVTGMRRVRALLSKPGRTLPMGPESRQSRGTRAYNVNRAAVQAARSSSATHSMCGVCGNMSTGRTRVRR